MPAHEESASSKLHHIRTCHSVDLKQKKIYIYIYASKYTLVPILQIATCGTDRPHCDKPLKNADSENMCFIDVGSGFDLIYIYIILAFFGLEER